MTVGEPPERHIESNYFHPKKWPNEFS